jgi:hypothetical protein
MENLPPEVEAAVRKAVLQDLPHGAISRIDVCEVSANAYVVRVFLPVEGLKPTPYRVCRIAIPSLQVRHLKGDESRPHRISNYK